jgi:hypothetical protein
MSEDKYRYNRFGSKGQRVGQAVYDILSTDQPNYSAEEIAEGMLRKITSEFEKTVEKGNQLFDHEYYILLYSNKDLTQFGVSNVVKFGFLIGDKLADFDPVDLTCKHPNWEKTFYKVNPKEGWFEILWHLPEWQRCQLIARDPKKYDPQLVNWIEACFSEKLSTSCV